MFFVLFYTGTKKEDDHETVKWLIVGAVVAVISLFVIVGLFVTAIVRCRKFYFPLQIMCTL